MLQIENNPIFKPHYSLTLNLEPAFGVINGRFQFKSSLQMQILKWPPLNETNPMIIEGHLYLSRFFPSQLKYSNGHLLEAFQAYLPSGEVNNLCGKHLWWLIGRSIIFEYFSCILHTVVIKTIESLSGFTAK